ncbi:hypothetical protein JXB37_08745 [candidate division WOR-3 bacterium]|nr:hypothetical protein [candidate division WOR-3 bacterium]
MLTICLSLLLVAQPVPDSGFVSVRSTLPGIEVWLDGDCLGRTPVERHPFRTGSFLLSIISNDSLENVYARVRTGGVGEKLSALWTLTAVDAGTYELEVRRNSVTEVTVDYGAIVAAPGKAKTLAGCAVGGVFGLGAVIGLLIGLLF